MCVSENDTGADNHDYFIMKYSGIAIKKDLIALKKELLLLTHFHKGLTHFEKGIYCDNAQEFTQLYSESLAADSRPHRNNEFLFKVS